MYSLILPRWEKRCQIIVAGAATLAPVEAVFAAGRILVWAEVDIDTAVHFPGKYQGPAGAGVVDTLAGMAGAAADIPAGTAGVVDLPAAQP